jgi:hypothetical protein
VKLVLIGEFGKRLKSGVKRRGLIALSFTLQRRYSGITITMRITDYQLKAAMRLCPPTTLWPFVRSPSLSKA